MSLNPGTKTPCWRAARRRASASKSVEKHGDGGAAVALDVGCFAQAPSWSVGRLKG